MMIIEVSYSVVIRKRKEEEEVSSQDTSSLVTNLTLTPPGFNLVIPRCTHLHLQIRALYRRTCRTTLCQQKKRLIPCHLDNNNR